jgi:hypothetical protein
MNVTTMAFDGLILRLRIVEYGSANRSPLSSSKSNMNDSGCVTIHEWAACDGFAALGLPA